jgi:cell division protease FtsH
VDEALLRPGRFTRHVHIGYPEDPIDRRTLIDLRLARTTVQNKAELVEELTKLTAGMTPAEIVDMLNEAILLGMRRAVVPALDDFHEARNLVLHGERRKQPRSKTTEERIAVHEAGHAILECLYQRPPVQVTIIGRAGSLGFVESDPGEDDLTMTQKRLEEMIDVLLAGRAAERMILGDTSAGAANDLRKATSIAADMIFRFGMDPEYGVVAISTDTPDDLLMQTDFWQRVNKLLQQRATGVEDLLNRHRDSLCEIRELLLNSKTVQGSQIASIVFRHGNG